MTADHLSIPSSVPYGVEFCVGYMCVTTL